MLAKRSFAASRAKRLESRALRAFLAPQRERASQLIPPQARELTLAKRATRKGRAS